MVGVSISSGCRWCDGTSLTTRLEMVAMVFNVLRVAGSETNANRQGFDGSGVLAESGGAKTKILRCACCVGMFRSSSHQLRKSGEYSQGGVEVAKEIRLGGSHGRCEGEALIETRQTWEE